MSGETGATAESPSLWADLMTLTKARLSMLVLVTTLVGFCLASTSGIDWVLMLHTAIGTGLVAGGAAALNQLMERRQDALMKRTRDRPLPAGRVTARTALLVGIGTSVVGCGYLAFIVNPMSAALAGLTLFVYIAIYTPLKQVSSTCTLWGAVSGAIPPVIGWVAAGGALGIEAAFLFGLLFLWQLPHFLAINWMYREDYEHAGFVMWSNEDVSGVRSSRLALGFAVLLVILTVAGLPGAFANAITFWGGMALGGLILYYSVRFFFVRERAAARGLFFCSILYLPLVLGVLLCGGS